MNLATRNPSAYAHRCIKKAREKKLTGLYLSNLGLSSLPPLDGLEHLEFLSLSGNNLRRLPNHLPPFPRLVTLFLDDNQLDTLPDWVGQCTNLWGLYLSGNQLTDLPKSLAPLKNLRQLHLNKNNFAAIPTVLQHLTNLQTLWMSNNHLTHLPDWLPQLSLRDLSLRNNQLQSLPDSLQQLKTLQSLDLRGNPKLGLPDRLLSANGNSIPPGPDPMMLVTEYFLYDEITRLHAQNPVNEPPPTVLYEAEVQARIDRVKRIWVPRHETAFQLKFVEGSYRTREHVSGKIELQENVVIHFKSGGSFLELREPNPLSSEGFFEGQLIGCLGYLISTGEIKIVPTQKESNLQALMEWLPLFRRNSWLCGFPIEATAHEKLEWIQGFTQQEIEAWNLQF